MDKLEEKLGDNISKSEVTDILKDAPHIIFYIGKKDDGEKGVGMIFHCGEAERTEILQFIATALINSIPKVVPEYPTRKN